MKYISLFTIINLLILAIFLMSHKSTIRSARFYLSALLLCMAVNMLDYYILNNDLYTQYIWEISLGYVTSSFIGPLFYLFVRSMMQQHLKISVSLWPHLIIPFLVLLNYISFQWQSSEVKITYVDSAISNYPIKESLINAIIAFQILGYLLASYKSVRRFQKCLEDNLSYAQNFNLKWLSNFIIFILSFFLILAASSLYIANQDYNAWAGQITVTIFYLFIFYKTITYPTIYIDSAEIQKFCVTSKMLDDYKSDKETDFSTIHKTLIHYIEEKKPYLIPKLSLEDLSRELNIKKHTLSQVINSQSGQNFFSLINRYRVEEAKNKLTNSQYSNLTIEAIGKECGFHSASNFFDVFKKTTGKTPTKYRNHIL